MKDHNKKYIPSDSSDQPSTSKPESGVSEEDRKRIDSYIRSHPDGGDFELYVRLKDIAEKVTEYERRDKAVLRAAYDELEKQWRDINRKQAELVEEIERLKSQLKDYCNDCQHPTVNEQQATELSKLRQENEAKRSDLTDKLEEAVHHMDNGHTAQATTLIYEVIGELEPKGE